jgi:hypothetical protein
MLASISLPEGRKWADPAQVKGDKAWAWFFLPAAPILLGLPLDRPARSGSSSWPLSKNDRYNSQAYVDTAEIPHRLHGLQPATIAKIYADA